VTRDDQQRLDDITAAVAAIREHVTVGTSPTG
jgi:hypothetical protein